MSGNSVCYLDLNNNGYWEAVDSTTYASQTTCNCGELGVGWVSGDAVNGFEVQGCTQVMIDGQICPEYNPQANVDNGSCCLTEVDFDEGWRVTRTDVNRRIHHTSFAVSNEESRPILNGVLWELRDGAMRMVATNGHRLARMGVPAESGDTSSADFIVPPSALQQVQRLFKKDEVLEVARSGNHLGFRAGAAEVYTRLIEGTYPNYDQVIPRDNDKIATVDKKALESAVRRMAVVASDQTHRIRLKFESGRLHLNVLTPDLGEGQDELEVGYEGEEIEIGFNANYLLEVLRYMPTDEVDIAFKAPERAVTIVPSEAENLDYLCLVMPLRLLD